MGKPFTWFTTVNIRDYRTGVITPVRVDLTLDLQRIALELGDKAYRNKSGRSKLSIGIVAEAQLKGAA